VLTVGVGSFGFACLAHLGLIVLLSVRRIGRHWAVAALILVTFAWAASGLAVTLEEPLFASAYDFLDFLRAAAILLLLNDAFRRLSTPDQAEQSKRVSDRIAPIASGAALGLGVFAWSGHPSVAFVTAVGHLGLAVAGLFLVDRLFQASRPDALWSTKHLLIGAGTILAFDLFYYTDALLLLRIDETLRATQPVIATLALPLILVSARRLREVKVHLPVSRSFVVGTTALLASGIYILSIAAIAYLIRGLGWAWGPTLQLIFLFGAVMVLMVLLSSTSLRHGGRRFIERNLFTFAYDYRREWLRLVESMASEKDNLTLDRRALKAAATLLDADGGALFMRSSTGGFRYKTCWNLAIKDGTPSAPPPSLLAALSPEHPVHVLGEPKEPRRGLRQKSEIDGWLEGFKDPWIALALIARNELVGLAVITRPRMRRRLSFEDLDLLAIFAHQLGSYLTVEELARHVAETEHFERMSKHVTFVAHDLKNVISQLSLVLQQAKDHAHNPVFVSDTFLTIGDAVERMKKLMHRVQEGAAQGHRQRIDLSALIQEIAASGRVDSLLACEGGLFVNAEPGTLRVLLDHLLDNAWEATAASEGAGAEYPEDDGQTPAPRVALSLREVGMCAILEIVDHGVGMTQAFIENELFSPFSSTKPTGFGIGMYQCREWIETWEGQLDVESEPDVGTTIRLALPLVEFAPASGDDSIMLAERREPKGRAA
jgi:putative PEP-CTERM system histidine kinase